MDDDRRRLLAVAALALLVALAGCSGGAGSDTAQKATASDGSGDLAASATVSADGEAVEFQGQPA